jgi:hypothetical protein
MSLYRQICQCFLEYFAVKVIQSVAAKWGFSSCVSILHEQLEA